ncbi:endonuclease domain-containing protein [Phenylobacterium sp.]|uniref:endonuclease domain-containing protein n=1 Tax=Phenylobacterium sp. TaxID=1871053 RepID=UPI002E37D9AB|nr:endonuclease domain-containing protein [Phenylobacterium sp.]HEX4710598.1 endonuclease domain-containing protein [Phenylobacterium sp.]
MRAPTPTHARAKALRSTLSLPEKLLWVRLRRRDPGHPRFRRQHPAGPFVLDFYCSDGRLCIEVDGAAHSLGDRPERDERRDAYLRARGIEVVRIAASSVLEDPESVTDWIRQMAGQRTTGEV